MSQLVCNLGLGLSCPMISCGCNPVNPHIDNDHSDTLSEDINEDLEEGILPERSSEWENSDPREDGELEEDSRYSSGRNQGRDGGSSRTGKRVSALKDQQSTGRKTAAKLFPLERDAPCEWRNRAKCGGGTYPIRGCLSGNQQARHHGPDKNVANNEPGNVHRICHYCHNRWHAANDPNYDWNSTEVNAHQPRTMTEQEIQEAVMDELRYQAKKNQKRGSEQIKD